jgi:segregation and condensation protein B
MSQPGELGDDRAGEHVARPQPPNDEVTADSPPPPLRIVEALLFIGGAPLKAETACAILRGFTPQQFLEAIEALNQAYRVQGRPYAIVPQGGGHVLTLRPRYRGVIEKLYGNVREARLSAAAIDTLAVIAYRQPVTKTEIDTVRGAESGTHIRQLVRRRLIAVVRRADAEQREVSYGTTDKFLSMFELGSLEDLPRTQDLQRI